MPRNCGSALYGDDVNSPGAARSVLVRQPRRRASDRGLRRLSQKFLVIGSVLALAAAFGPLWLTRVGLVVAVAAAVIACFVAWREVTETRRSFSAETLRAARAHRAALTEERRHNAAVLDTLTGRIVRSVSEAAQLRGSIAGFQVTVEKLQVTVEKLNAIISSLRGELQGLRSEHAATSEELRRGQQLVGVLQETVRSREAELEALSEPGQVRSIPRRVLAEHAEPEHAEHEHIRVVTELVYEAVVLPNYEGDRKLA